MTAWTDDMTLSDDQRSDPFLWIDYSLDLDMLPKVDDDTMAAIFGGDTRSTRRIRTYGHVPKNDKTAPHFLATRGGLTPHVDVGFVRYSHQIVLRNDGWQTRGLDHDKAPLLPRGSCYCLDTGSPHEVVKLPDSIGPHKFQVVVDAPEPLSLYQVRSMLLSFLAARSTSLIPA